MSRSIKQYKDAMDSIRISESFAKRTETLLKEAGESESVSLSRRNGAHITVKRISFAACAGLAACIAAIFIIRPAAPDIANIDSGDANITAVTSVTDVTVTGDETVYVDIEEDSEEYIREGDKAVEILESEYYPETASENTAAAGQTSPAAAPETAAPETAVQETEQEKQAHEHTRKEQESVPAVSAVPSEVITKDKAGDEKPDEIEFAVPVYGDYDDDLCDDADDTGSGSAGWGEDSPESAGSTMMTAGTSGGSGSGLYYIDYSAVDAELVSYVNGETPVSMPLDGGDMKYLVSMAAYAVYSAPETEQSKDFVSEFVLVITDTSSGNTLYTVYVTSENKLIVADHTGEKQVRKTYIPDAKEFSEMEKSMFLCFGTESGYNEFMYKRSNK